jgi:hypothetical protein
MALSNYVKRQSTVQGPNGLYIDDEFDKISQSIAAANNLLTTFTAPGGVPLTSLAGIATGRFLGNISGSTASPVALTGTQVTANLDVATVTLKGLVPAPGSSSGRYLKDDLTWSTITLSYLTIANNLSDVANAATARTNLGISTVGHTGAYSDLSGLPTLGTAAAQNVGTSVNNVVQMAAGPKLPAVDGSALTNMTQCEPVQTSSTYPVGTAMYLWCGGTVVTNGSTTSGANLTVITSVQQGVTDGGGSSIFINIPTSSGVAVSGTWKNISGFSTFSCIGLFVRTV